VLLVGEFFVRKFVVGESLKAIFFAKPELVVIYRKNAEVIMIECTYKTNDYGLPLLNIYFFTRTGLALPLAHALIDNEKQDGYTWALRCFTKLFDELYVDELSVFLHNRDLTSMNSFEGMLPGRYHMLRM